MVVTIGSFKGYYALVTSNSYGKEVEIQYPQKQLKWWIVREIDLDSIEPSDLEVLQKKVALRHHLIWYLLISLWCFQCRIRVFK